MAAAEIIATGSTAANSADVVITASTTIGLKGQTDRSARVKITLKDDAGAYNDVSELSATSPVIEITGPGTYRFSRVAGGTCGVFSA